MIRLDRVLKERGLAARMILQVHDELLLEAPDGEWREVAALAKREMEGVADLKIPLKVELKSGPNWAEMSGAA
jgi:DNA polymerase-1